MRKCCIPPVAKPFVPTPTTRVREDPGDDVKACAVDVLTACVSVRDLFPEVETVRVACRIDLTAVRLDGCMMKFDRLVVRRGRKDLSNGKEMLYDGTVHGTQRMCLVDGKLRPRFDSAHDQS